MNAKVYQFPTRPVEAQIQPPAAVVAHRPESMDALNVKLDGVNGWDESTRDLQEAIDEIRVGVIAVVADVEAQVRESAPGSEHAAVLRRTLTALGVNPPPATTSRAEVRETPKAVSNREERQLCPDAREKPPRRRTRTRTRTRTTRVRAVVPVSRASKARARAKPSALDTLTVAQVLALRVVNTLREIATEFDCGKTRIINRETEARQAGLTATLADGHVVVVDTGGNEVARRALPSLSPKVAVRLRSRFSVVDIARCYDVPVGTILELETSKPERGHGFRPVRVTRSTEVNLPLPQLVALAATCKASLVALRLDIELPAVEDALTKARLLGYEADLKGDTVRVTRNGVEVDLSTSWRDEDAPLKSG